MSSAMAVVFGHAGSSCGKPVGGVPVVFVWHEMPLHAPVCPMVRAWPLDSTSMFEPPCTCTFVPNDGSMPTCNPGLAYGVPFARTYCAERTPYFLSFIVAVAQSSIAFAPLFGSVSASCKPMSHGFAFAPGMPAHDSLPQ